MYRIRKPNDFDFKYDEFEDDVYQETSNIIDDLIGKKITEDQREEFINSIMRIFRDTSRNFKSNERQRKMFNNQIPNNMAPCVNIYIVSQPNPMYPPNAGYVQPQMNSIQQYQSNIPSQNPLIQMPQQPIQAPQQPFYNFFGYQASLPVSQLKKKKHQKEKSSSHKKKKDDKHSKSSKQQKKSEKGNFEIKTFKYSFGDHFNGIIHYLTEKNGGGNIHDAGVINVTSNSINSNDFPQNVLVPSEKSSGFGRFCYYKAKSNTKDFWVCFDFKDMRIEIFAYTVKSGQWTPNSGHIKSWVLEVSDNGNSWKEVDKQINVSELNGPNNLRIFFTKQQIFARYCRIRHFGNYWGQSCNPPTIDQMEFFGNIKIPKK